MPLFYSGIIKTDDYVDDDAVNDDDDGDDDAVDDNDDDDVGVSRNRRHNRLDITVVVWHDYKNDAHTRQREICGRKLYSDD